MYPSEMEEKPFNPTNLHKDTMEARLLKKGVCVCVCVCVCGNVSLRDGRETL